MRRRYPSKAEYTTINTMRFQALEGKHTRNLFLALSLIWMLTFPAKGVLFQLSLYLIPLCVLLITDFRLRLLEQRYYFLLLTGLLVLPSLLSQCVAYVVYDIDLSRNLFNDFWRLVLLPLSFFAVILVLRLPMNTGLPVFVGCIVLHGVIADTGYLYALLQTEDSLSSRFSGPLYNPNPFGLLMGTGFVLAVYQMLINNGGKKRWLWFPVAVLLLTNSILSGSRSAVLATLAATALLIVYKTWHSQRPLSHWLKEAIIVISILVLAILAISISPMGEYLNERLTNMFTDSVRMRIWNHYLDQTLDHLWFGSPILTADRYMEQGVDFGPHNMYILSLRETGLFGLLALLTFITWAARQLLKSRRRSAGLSLSLLLLLCIYCTFNSSIISGDTTVQGVFTLFLLTLFVSIQRDVPSSQPANSH